MLLMRRRRCSLHACCVKAIGLLGLLIFESGVLANSPTLHAIRGLVVPAQSLGFVGTIIQSANSSHGAKLTTSGVARSHGTAEVVESRVFLINPATATRITVFGWAYAGDLNRRGGYRYPVGQSPTSLDELLVGCSAAIPAGASVGSYVGEAHFRIMSGGEQVIVPFSIQMAILAEDSVANQRPMIFPIQMVGYSSTYVMSPDASGAAIFSVRGDAGTKAVAEVVPSVVYLTRPVGDDRIEVFGFKFGGLNGRINPFSGAFRFPRGGGQTIAQGIQVGASAYYRSGLQAGVYRGSAIFRVTYR